MSIRVERLQESSFQPYMVQMSGLKEEKTMALLPPCLITHPMIGSRKEFISI